MRLGRLMQDDSLSHLKDRDLAADIGSAGTMPDRF